MSIEITNTITVYEIIAIATAVFIPLFQMIIKRFVFRPKLNYFANEFASLYYNAGGSQICICGVFEISHQPAVVRKVELTIEDTEGNLLSSMDWAYVVSPEIHQNVQNTIAVSNTQVTTRVHPIKIQPNEITNADLYFLDNCIEPQMQKELRSLWELACEKHAKYPDNFTDAQNEFINSPIFSEAKHNFEKSFLWRTGVYTATMITKYKRKELQCKYKFEVSKYDSMRLERSIEILLMWYLQNAYQMPTGICDIVPVKMSFVEKKLNRFTKSVI